MQEMQSLDIKAKMCQFDKQNSGKSLFVIMRQYLQMITEVLQYIRAVRTGNWHLHPQSTETFIKYFFAHGMLNYARMMPVYLSDMENLKDSEATIPSILSFCKVIGLLTKNSSILCNWCRSCLRTHQLCYESIRGLNWYHFELLRGQSFSLLLQN